ncbi:DNA-binding protein HEXBP-like [Cucumis melo var. makuwa]|uniref:DNA-binding protein HEXBP-like n=1 Tax=Cucumis melo var. makuwa TaxID=1194695 RepID=A0A5A7TVA1_CUCMM|nr:DNA-binding protein HEXBP-like [Cucumis melo var. makuwa]
MILAITDLRFVFMEECPPFPTQNASQSVKYAYDCWTKANDKARPYILASMFDILSKKHEIMSLKGQKEGEANVVHSMWLAPSSSGSKKIQKRKGGKGKGPTIAVEGKGKAKETSSFKQLEESEMTLKVGTGDVISACAVGDAKYGYLYLMEHKSEALEKFKEYKAELENLLSKKIKILHGFEIPRLYDRTWNPIPALNT